MSIEQKRFTVALDVTIYDELKERADFCFRSVSAEAGILILGALKAAADRKPTTAIKRGRRLDISKVAR